MTNPIGWPPNLDRSFEEYFWAVKQNPRLLLEGHEKQIEHFVRDNCFVLEDVILVPRDVIPPIGFHDHIGFPFFIGFPFCSYEIVPRENSIFEDIWCGSPSLMRLARIKQLSYITGYVYDSQVGEYIINSTYLTTGYTSFSHTRAQHSLIVSLLMAFMLDGFPKYDYINGVLAGAFHDIATPAGGEATAGISDEYDEEENFEEVFLMLENIDKWKEKHPEFDLDYIADIVKNRGLVGRILDICDKIAYVILDCHAYATSGHNNMTNFAVRNPLFGDVMWQLRITPDRQDVYFTDPVALYYFLYAKALEYEDLLKNPGKRVNEWYVRNLIKQLINRGLLSRLMLLTLDDYDILTLIKDTFGDEVNMLFRYDTEFQAIVSKPESIQENILSAQSRGWDFLGQEPISGFKADTDILVKNTQGKIVPFKEAEPARAYQLEAMASSTSNIGLYFKTNDPPNITNISGIQI